MNLNQLTLKQALKLLKQKQILTEELYQDTVNAIDSQNKKLNIYLTVDNKASDLAQKQKQTLLYGTPIAVKDNFLTVGLNTTASAKVLNKFKPVYESTVTQKIKQSGGIIIGKTNMDAWAHGSSTETSDYGSTKNPRNPRYLPGGSSGGSAAAVAADLCLAALGSETAGSIRQPAAWCGIVGLKPTYGRVSRYGIVAMGSSLDSPGPMGKTVEDTSILLSVIAGQDMNDATAGDVSVPDYTKYIYNSIKGLKIGICYIDHSQIKKLLVADAINKAGEVFEQLQAKVELVPISNKLEPDKILNPDYAVGLYTVIQRSEVSSNLARYDGIRFGHDRSYFGAEAKRRIMLGTFTLSAGYADKYYLKALKVRSLYIKNFQQLFSKYDILISPTSPGFALPLGASAGNPMFGELEDMLLEASSIAGLPGINIPCYYDPKTNLFLGMNIIANQWQEDKILRAASAFEQNTNWNHWIHKRI